jgi:hypothetical protein
MIEERQNDGVMIEERQNGGVMIEERQNGRGMILLTLNSVTTMSTTLPTTIRASKEFQASMK